MHPYYAPDFQAFWPLMLLIWFVVLPAFRYGRSSRRALPAPAQRSEDRALAILRERYARGEISQQEYEERRAALLGESYPAPPSTPPADDQPWPY